MVFEVDLMLAFKPARKNETQRDKGEKGRKVNRSQRENRRIDHSAWLILFISIV